MWMGVTRVWWRGSATPRGSSGQDLLLRANGTSPRRARLQASVGRRASPPMRGPFDDDAHRPRRAWSSRSQTCREDPPGPEVDATELSRRAPVARVDRVWVSQEHGFEAVPGRHHRPARPAELVRGRRTACLGSAAAMPSAKSPDPVEGVQSSHRWAGRCRPQGAGPGEVSGSPLVDDLVTRGRPHATASDGFARVSSRGRYEPGR